MQEIELKLNTPISTNGVTTNILKIRSPTVGDHLAADSMPENDLMKEIYLIASLCQISIEDVKKLALKDYKAIQAAIESFLD